MALRDQPYLPLYVQDFMTDEKLIECSAATTGVYIRLMCLMHKSEKYGTILLRQKDKQTTNQIKNFAYKVGKSMPYIFEVVHDAILELVTEGVLQIEGDQLIQRRMVKDFDISIKRSEAGTKGGNKTTFAKAKHKANTQANSENEFEYENENEIKNENEFEIMEYPAFSDFWDMYDKKRGDKDKVQKRWKQLTQKDKEAIMEYLPAYLLSTPDKQFRKDPLTFLNNKSWNDEIITATTQNGKQPRKLNFTMEQLDPTGILRDSFNPEG